MRGGDTIKPVVRALALSGIFAVMLAPAACGESDDGSTSFTVWVFEERTAVEVAERGDQPLAGAEIAFDPPGGGTRRIARAAADGHVAFDADFRRGGASITVFDVDHVLVSVLQASPDTARQRPNELGKPSSDLVVLLPRLDELVRRTSVELRGALARKRDAASLVDLSASGVPRLGSTTTELSSYAMRAPRARGFFLLGHETRKLATATPSDVDNEHIGSFRIDAPPLAGDAVIDVDVAGATRLSTRAVRVTAQAPNDPRSPFGAGTRVSAIVVSADSELLIAPIRQARATNGEPRAFELAMTVADVDIAPERPLTRVALVAADSSRSVRIEPGIAADGAVWKDFPLPPFVPEASRSLADPLPLDDFPDGADLVVEVYGGNDLGWRIFGPPGGLRDRTVKLPSPLEIRLPALVAVSILARTERVALPPRGEVFRRTAITRDVVMRR